MLKWLRRIVVAESMGAAIVGQYLAHGASPRVVGLALDAPALDVPMIVAAQGHRYQVPAADIIEPLALWEFSLWRGLDLTRARSIDAVAGFKGPIFLAHGRGDPLVPVAISTELAGLKPDAIYVETEADQHPLSYKADTAGYLRGLNQWLHVVQQLR